MSLRLPVSRDFCALASALVSLILMAGCNQSGTQPSSPSTDSAVDQAGEGDYDPHDAPLTEEQKLQLREQADQFPKAVEMIKEFRTTTEEETKNGIPENPFNVHQALDRVDLILQWLPEIARDSDVPKEHWEEVTTTANDLRTLFEKVHQNIDNQQEPDFASVAGEIDEKIVRLAEIAQPQPSASSEPQP